MAGTVIIVPIGTIERDVLSHISSAIGQAFRAECRVEMAVSIPELAFERRRAQYHGSMVFDAMPEHDGYIVLGVSDVDLYVPGLNFIFGLANPHARKAVISLVRLRQEFWDMARDKELFMERAVKEAVHEVGHVCGLVHCPDPICVMHFSNSLADTDIKGSRFCRNCKKRLGR